MAQYTSSPSLEEHLGQAYEQNMTAYTVALAAAGDGIIQRDADAVLAIFPFTFWSNSVVSPRFTKLNAPDRINAVLAVYRRYRREVWFHVGPSSTPPALASMMKSRGLWNAHNRPFMGCELNKLVTSFPQPEGISIQALTDYEAFREFPHPIHGLVKSTRMQHIFSTYARLDERSPRQHWMYIAIQDCTPVAVADLYIEQHIAGIYDVEVLSTHRRKGIGSALIQTVCEFARGAGAEYAVLAASEQGVHFYPRFGFIVVGRFPTYYYSIKKQKQDTVRLHEVW